MQTHNPFTSSHFSLNCKGQLLLLHKPVVMGIVNVTPDSFYDGGNFIQPAYALNQAESMLKTGASIIDIGGSSSRPGAREVSLEEELQRVIPAIELIHSTFPQAIISIDTNKAKVAVAAVSAGASIVNDISAGDDDEAMIGVVADLKVPFIAMHKKGNPQTMQLNPEYQDVCVEVLDYFIKKLSQLKEAGIRDIVLDPGFGFGKTTNHNYALLKNLSVFKMLGMPLLVGVSRKRMINEVLKIEPKEALNGTTVLNTIALMNGARILRVHDVKQAVEAVDLFNCYSEQSL